MGFLVKRIVYLIPTFFGLTLISFFFLQFVPGDPVAIITSGASISPEKHAQIVASLGLDKPYWQQYLSYLWNLAHLNFGYSYVSQHAVLEEFKALLPASLELGFSAFILAVIIGLPAGMLAAIKRDKFIDKAATSLYMLGYSIPIFWWGLVLIMLLCSWFDFLPLSGRIDPAFKVENITGFMLVDSLISGQKGAFVSALQHLLLPTIVLATAPLAIIARQTRQAMLLVSSQDYMRTARAKGLPAFRLYVIHAGRNVLIPVIATIGFQASTLIAASILTETIFAWPGVGKWLVDAVSAHDYSVLQAGIFLVALLIMLVNLMVDIISGLINPKISQN